MTGVNEKLIFAFIDATVNVMETMASTRAKAGQPFVKKDAVASGDVSGIMGLAGEKCGTLSVSFSEKSILAIVSSMLGENIAQMNDDIKDAVGEITNMISGQARQRLAAIGISLQGAIPSVIMGKNHTISPSTESPVVAVPFQTNDGAFTIEVCIEQ